MYIIESKYKNPDKYIKQLKFRIKWMSKYMQTLIELHMQDIKDKEK